MELRLERDAYSETCTLGTLYAGAETLAYTCEDRVRALGAKVAGRTAIPPGRYRVVITHSPRFGRELPLLKGVPGFAGIRIHPGNDPKDTEGCILVGLERGPGYVARSLEACREVERRIRAALDAGEEAWITVEQGHVPARLLAPETTP